MSSLKQLAMLGVMLFSALPYAAQTPHLLATQAGGVSLSGDNLETAEDLTCEAELSDLDFLDWRKAHSLETFNESVGPCFWLRAGFKVPESSNISDQSKWYVELGHHGLNVLYLYENGILIQRDSMGNDLPVNRRAYPHVWSKSYLNIAPLTLKHGVSYQLVAKYANPIGQTLYGTNDKVAITFIPAADVDQESRLHLVISGLMMGGLLLLFLYQFAQWTVYKTALDATYCFMLLGLMSYILYDDFILHAVFADKRVSELWLYVTGSLGLLGFFRFAQLTLRSVNFNALRDKTMGWLVLAKAVEVGFYLTLVLMSSALGGFWQTIASYIPEVFRLILLSTLALFCAVMFFYFRENSDKATRSFLFGNLSLVVGVLIVTTQAYILPFANVVPIKWYLNAIWPVFDYIIEAGIVGMALFFAFAVASLTKEREIGIERAFNRRLLDVEMKSLRSQMNPHFLFNGLNSIKSYVIDNKPAAAAEYLSKFAKLIRYILENSKTGLVSLEREIETLSLYISMEAERFSNRFSYELVIDESIEIRALQIPPMLIQPYVENAIWHGLLHREDGGNLSISLEKSGVSEILITILDNGIGREASGALKRNAQLQRKSLGMEITKERIEMLRELYQFNSGVEIIDEYDEAGNPCGTRVVLRVEPIITDYTSPVVTLSEST